MSKPALIAATALSLLCACSKTQTYSTKDASVTVTDKGKDQGSLKVVAKDGTTLDINSGKPITDYPSDAPLYSGKSVMDMKSAEKNARVVAIQTSDSIEKISGFYKGELEAKGWKTESTMTTPQMTMYVASKGERKLVVQISSDSNNTQSVSQTLSDK
jgi:hypothetical protein